MERNTDSRRTTGYLAGEEARGAGGKVRKGRARRFASSATPYARPQPILAQRTRPWLSRLANLILPSFFSQSSSATALPAPPTSQRAGEDEEEEEEEEDQGDSINRKEEVNDRGDDRSLSFNHLVPGSTELGGASEAANEINSRPELERLGEQHKVDTSGHSDLSEIEQLLQGRKFSREEFNRLVDIIHSRAASSPNKEQEQQYSGRDAGGSAFLEESQRRSQGNHGILRQSILGTSEHRSSSTQGGVVLTPWAENSRNSDEGNRDVTNRATWLSSTPVVQSTIEDEVGASPVQIAKAYMQKRTSESGLGPEDPAVRDEGPSSRGDELALQPFMPSSSVRSSTCWPGARVGDQTDYATPLSQRGRFGLGNYRSPYARAIGSKSKTKLLQLQGNNDKPLNMLSTPFRPAQTSTYGQFSSRDKKLGTAEGSVGPIRRTRRLGAVDLPARGSPFLRSSVDTPKVGNFNDSEGLFSAWKKDSEKGRSSYSEVSAPTVPTHSSRTARKIFEHLEKIPVTPKEKSAELRLATSWRKPESSNTTSLTLAEHNSLPQFGNLDSSGKSNQVDKNKSVHWGEDKGKSILFPDTQETGSKANDGMNTSSPSSSLTIANNAAPLAVDPRPSQVFGLDKESQVLKANENVAISEAPNLRSKKPPTHSTGTKPVLSSISIAKREQKWAAASDGMISSGFTFQVAASSGTSSEPPTPSMPSSYSNGVHQPEADAGQSIPTYSFGSSKSSPPLVFSFPSSTSSPVLPDGASDLKFSFGSDESGRVNFSSIGKDSICY